ncbi:MAG TPA: MFS transporter [Ktedonobacterales bacterium]
MPLRVRRPRFEGLWRHPDFLKLWTGQSVSVFGTLITKVALPIVAVLTLHATPAQVALIYAAQVAPTLAFGLVAGALADRVRRRPLLIIADVGRALTLVSVPLAAVTGALSLHLIYAVTLITSALSALFNIAYPAYLPALVGEERLLEGNARLGASLSVAEVAGFGLAGALVQALTASGAIVVDIATYVVSVVSLTLIRTREPAPQRPHASEQGAPALSRLRREVSEGLRLTWRHPTRRALAGVALVQALCGGMLEPVLFIFVLRDLHISPAEMTLTFGVGGAASFLGATLTQRITGRLGMRRTLRLSALVGAAFALLIPLAGGPLWLAVACLVATQFGDAGYTIYDIAQMTTLQRISPSGALGRINASIQFVAGMATVVGLALGAALGQPLGARGTLLLATLGMLLGPLWLTLERIAPAEATAEAGIMEEEAKQDAARVAGG